MKCHQSEHETREMGECNGIVGQRHGALEVRVSSGVAGQGSVSETRSGGDSPAGRFRTRQQDLKICRRMYADL